MNDEVARDQSPEASNDFDEQEYERLRELLLSPEQDLIQLILHRLDNPETHAREVGGVLPRAIEHSSSQGPGLEYALAPILQKATREAIRSDRKAFADALFPVIGPAIRKAIAEALRSLVQSLNQALEYSLSPRGLRWRIEALRTGKSFAEVVLSHTVVFRVEQIFLIHRENGLLLQHVVAPEVDAEDADMVSGMLTAIQDFVRDSFRMDQNENLQTMEVGDLQVWVEQGPRAVLAAAVRGNAPVELRHKLQETLESIHDEYPDLLARFEGDASPFAVCRPRIKDCLENRRETPVRKTSWALRLIVLAGLIIIGGWVWTGWRFDHKLNNLLGELEKRPGIVVADVSRWHARAEVRGLRDPLASDPEELLDSFGLSPSEVRFRWHAYQALTDDFVLQRARRVLQPPEGVELQLEKGTLLARGSSAPEWRQHARAIAAVVAGVDRYDDSGLKIRDEAAARERRIQELRRAIEAHFVTFDVGQTDISDEQNRKLAPVVEKMAEIIELAQENSAEATLVVEGFTDPSGSQEMNAKLSQERAENVVAYLTGHGIPDKSVKAIGRGATTSTEMLPEGDPGALRKVSFRLRLSTDPTPTAKPSHEAPGDR